MNETDVAGLLSALADHLAPAHAPRRPKAPSILSPLKPQTPPQPLTYAFDADDPCALIFCVHDFGS